MYFPKKLKAPESYSITVGIAYTYLLIALLISVSVAGLDIAHGKFTLYGFPLYLGFTSIPFISIAIKRWRKRTHGHSS